MATTEIFVESQGKSGQHTSDWIVKKGSGRGATELDRKQMKSAAIKRAEQAARGVVRRTDNDALVKVQNREGHWRTHRKYEN